MDSITQIALGAAVGEAVLGRKVGYKAPLWGGAAALIPDLDIMVLPFLDSVDRLTFHRGISHSIVFSLLLAPLLGSLLHVIYKKMVAVRWDWIKLSFWALFTHPLLDCLTLYGTQLFQPFSDYRVSINSIFIIDPFYTVPLILSTIVLLFYRRESKKRRWINYVGLGLSTGYLIFTLVNKLYVATIFEASLEKQNIPYTRFLTNPAPLTNILWTAIVEGSDSYWIGYYSLLDDNRDISFRRIEKNHNLIEKIKHQEIIERLIFISNGYYCIREENGSIIFYDIKFGQMGGWIKGEGQFVFSYKLIKTENDHVTFQRHISPFGSSGELFEQLVERIRGI